MKREDYLAALGAALEGYGFAQREDSVAEMRSHIEELEARHPELGEEEIVAGLTPPEVLAKALRDEFGAAPDDSASSKANKGRAAFEKLGRSFEAAFGAARTIRQAVRAFGSSGGEARRTWAGSVHAADAEGLRFKLLSGDIQVVSAAGEALELRLELRGDADSLEDWEPAIETREGLIVIDAEEGGAGSRVHVEEAELGIPSSIRRLSLGTLSGDIDIEPEGLSLDLSSSSGDIAAKGVVGFRAKTLSGDVDLEGAWGPVAVSTQSGDVSIEDASEALQIETVSGDIDLTDIRSIIKAESSSGDIGLEAGSGFGGGEVATVSGDVELDLEGADLELRIETVSGEVDAPGARKEGRDFGRWKLILGSGRSPFVVRSVSGDISLDVDE